MCIRDRVYPFLGGPKKVADISKSDLGYFSQDLAWPC